ncbi:MAG: amidohydrolase family protein [Pseudomonadota bacterium]
MKTGIVLTVFFGLFSLSCSQNISSKSQRTLLPAKVERATKAWENIPIIDAHIHTYFDGNKTQEGLLEEWKKAGVVGGVAHVGRDGSGYVDLKAQHVVHCAGMGEEVNALELEAGLVAKKYGCIKIYLGYIHQYAYSEAYEPAYILAQKYQVPVVFHTGDTYSTTAELKYADPLTIDEVAVKHPQVTFVIAHCGNPWIESAAEVAYKNPNVYLDGSALLIGDLSRMAPEDIEAYVIRPLRWVYGYTEGSKKLMFGTDWPLTSVKPYLEAFKKAIPQEAWKDVFYNNAVRIFKIPGLNPLP